jgi:hypothetical protein
VRALLLDQSDLPVGVPECDQVLAEQSHPGRGVVRLGNFRRQARRNPVPAQQIPHLRARADPGQDLIVFR